MNMISAGGIGSQALELERPSASAARSSTIHRGQAGLRQYPRSSPLRVMTVFGTRPEGIKMMPVLRELRRRQSIDLRVCVTGQHRAMIDQVFLAFGERPDIDLDIMATNQTLSDVTAKVLGRMNDVLAQEQPDLVLVHGDTTTAFAAAMAAFYARIPIGHVEAGLRSHDLGKPWPEEFNRVAIDAVADLMFAPTAGAAANLAHEYNKRGGVYITGNTGIDALMHMSSRIDQHVDFSSQLRAGLPFLDDNRKIILVTGHRRESFGDGFEAICDGLTAVADRGDVQIIYPVHLNPEIQGVVRRRLSSSPNIHLIQPLDYASMVFLMRLAAILITDSGGIQEEGPALGKPVLVMRDVTERPEAIACGAARLIGTDPQMMRRQVDALLDDQGEYEARSRILFPYGDGTAAVKICDLIQELVV